MRKMLRYMAKSRMTKSGTTKVNKRMSDGRWRRYVNAYPINAVTGKKMPNTFIGSKKSGVDHKVQHRKDCMYSYC